MITLEERESEQYESSQYTDTRRRHPFQRFKPTSHPRSSNEDGSIGKNKAQESGSLGRSKTRNLVEGLKDSNFMSESPEITAFEESERRLKNRSIKKFKSLGLHSKLEQSILARKSLQPSTKAQMAKII